MAYSDSGSGTRESYSARTFLNTETIVDSDRGYARGPVRDLMAALLFDGVQAYMAYIISKGSARTRCKEAFTWVNTPGTDYLFSFDSVCEALGVDPNFLRYGLLNACNTRREEWKRGRRNF